MVGIPHPTHGEEVGAAVVAQAGRRGHPGGAAGLRQGAGRGLQVPAARVAGRRRCPRADRQDAAPRGGPRPRAWHRERPARRRGRAAGPAAGRRPRSGRPAGCCPGAPEPGSPPAWPAGPTGWPSGRPRSPASSAGCGAGRSTLAPAPGDRRFTDPAWTHNPLLRRLVQAYLAAAGTAEGLVADADLDWRDGERMRLRWSTTWSRRSRPSNLPAAQPGLLAGPGRHSGGASVVRGVRHLATRPGHAATGAVDGRRPTPSRWAPTWR